MSELPRVVRGHTYTVMTKIFLEGKLGILGGGGGASTPQIP